jgi:hypothetical protein
VRPARPRSPARATRRSFIEADGVASCFASGVVDIGVVVMCREEKCEEKEGRRSLLRGSSYIPLRRSVCRLRSLKVRERVKFEGACARADEGGGRAGKSEMTGSCV